MRGGIGTAILVARAWGAKQLVAAVVGVVALSAAWRGPVAVPLRRDVAELIWPLAPCLFALVIPRVAERTWTDQERTAPRSGRGRRLVFVAVLTLVAAGAAALLAFLHPFAVLARNSLLLIGLGLASTVLLPSSTRWIPASLYPIATWLLGARSGGEPAAGWAVLLHSPGSQVAAWWAVACFALGAGLYVLAHRPLRA